MPKTKIYVNTTPEQIFPIVSDLTRHAQWGIHRIEISAVADGPVQVGAKYQCVHGGRTGDLVTVTEVSPNERFSFHSTMPNGIELDHTFTLTPQNGGTMVTRNASLTRLPMPLSLFKPLLVMFIALAAHGPDGKFLKNMKSTLEESDSTD